jgi:hypothetical protein
MRFWTPITRPSLLLTGTSFALLISIICGWVFLRFLLRESQNRLLAPEHFDVQVVTADDYRRLSDPMNREVTLSDGTHIAKAPVWEEIVLPNYKATDDRRNYVLVMTRGTAHCLSYVEHDYLLFGLLAAWAVLLSFWNQRLLQRERPSGSGSVPPA